MARLIELFLLGAAVSFGPCLVHCSPAILVYIAGTKRGWKRALAAVLLFSAARLAGHTALGLLAGSLGGAFAEQLQRHGDLINVAGGAVIALIGAALIGGAGYGTGACRLVGKRLPERYVPLLMGLFAGIIPCLPIMAVLIYIVLNASGAAQGALFGMAFGLGSSISPLIPLGVLAGVLPSRTAKTGSGYDMFRRVCGLVLFLMGVNLVLAGLI